MELGTVAALVPDAPRRTEMRTRIAILAVALTILIGLASVRSEPTADRPSIAAAATPTASSLLPAQLSYQWRAGESYRYHVDFGADIRLNVAGTTQEQRVDVVGVLRLRALAVDGAGTVRLEASFPELQRFVISVDGTQVADSGDRENVLAAETVHLVVNDVGEVLEERFAEGAPAPVTTLLAGIARELLPDLRNGVAHEEAGLLGVGRVHSQISADEGHARITRTRASYSTVFSHPDAAEADATGEFSAHFDPRGHVARIAGTETARLPGVATWDWSLEAIAAPTRTFSLTDELRVSAPHTRADEGSADVAAENLRLRIGSMTAESFLSDLFNLPASGRFADHNSWLYRAGGLLEAHPELCAELADLIVRSTGFSDAAQLLALDLLAGVGHADAHRALRTVLADDGVAARGTYHRMLQSAVLIGVHDPQTVAFYSDLVRGGSAENRGAALAMLGHLGAVAAATHDSDSASSVARTLNDALDAAANDNARREVLRAVGNLATPTAEMLVTPYLNDEDAWTRTAALRALRHVETESAREALWHGLADSEEFVRTQALRALSRDGLSQRDLDRLVERGPSGVGDAEAVILIEASLGLNSPDRARLLDLLSGVTSLSASTRERLRALQPRETIARR